MIVQTPGEVLDFWIGAGPEKWFSHDKVFDDLVGDRFARLHEQAEAGLLKPWENAVGGALALVIVLDQFSRNMFRNTPRAFANDAAALGVAEHAIDRRFDLEAPASIRRWFYMPFMHSENLGAQEHGLVYFETRLDNVDSLEYARSHYDIIRRFGRFPHRNRILGRSSTDAEAAFLAGGGFSG